ncbi:hypothetical protein L208DRAFT_769593 [Tricholoma matsutake]|nr:hypothetical protein L208DRAFT_769593 [Tricholoma matsutake 945]
MTAELQVSAFNSRKAVEEAQSLIDQEIDDTLGDAIRVLKRRRNAISLVSRLPPEVLSNIFRFTRMVIQSDSGEDQYTLTWITVTHVCSHWRAVAINCLDLWDHIFTPPLTISGLQELLHRSKKAPLMVITHVRLFPCQGVEKFRALWQHVSRIRHIGISTTGTFGSSTWSKDCLPENPSSAPLLEAFALSHVEVIVQRRFPDNFFAGDLPALRQVTLVNCPVNCGSSLFKQLKHLSISLSFPDKRIIPSMSQLLHMLSNLSDVETLELHRLFPPVDGSTSASNRTILLPRLTRLAVTSDLLPCTAVLNQLHMPSLKSLNLQCHKASLPTVSNILPTLSYWDNLVRVEQHTVITRLLCKFTGADIMFSTFACEGEDSLVADSGLKLELVNFSDLEVVHSVSKILSLQNLEHLCIANIMELGEDRWLDCFGSLPNLKKISVSDCDRYRGEADLLSALASEVLPDASTLSGPTLYFPALCELDIEYWGFDGTSSENLRSCLQKRHKFQMGIHQLQFEHCPGLARTQIVGWRSQIVALKKIVPRVILGFLDSDSADMFDEGGSSDELQG